MRDIIVYIGSIFLPDKSAGAQRALSLSKSFRDIGYQVVIVGMEEGLASSVDILQTKRECQGFDTYAVPAPHHLSDWVCHSFSIKSFIKILQAYGLQRIHSVVAMEYEAFALSKLSVFCKRHGIHLIADAEEWYDRSSLPFPLNLGKDIDTHHRMYHVYTIYDRKQDICRAKYKQKNPPYDMYQPFFKRVLFRQGCQYSLYSWHR